MQSKEEKLEKIIANAQPVIDQMPEIVFFKSNEFTYAGANLRLLEFAKLKKFKDVIGKNDFNLPWSENAKTYREIDHNVISGKEQKIAMKVRIASGELKPAIQRKKPLRDIATGEILAVMVVMEESKIDFINSTLDFDQGKYLSEITTQYMVSSYDCKGYDLSTRESECLFYLLRGMQSKAIGKRLGLSPRTIEKFIDKLKVKFKCHYKTELIEKAIEQGLTYIIPESISLNKLQS